MKPLQPHKLASIFPPLTEEEQAALNESVRANGLKIPIVTFEGKCLDGRHREIACQETGTKPRYEQFKGNHAQALAFVMAANLHRRHLTTSQRAMIAAQIANGSWGGDRKSDQVDNCPLDPVTREEAAAKLGVSAKSLDRAAAVIAEAPSKIVSQVKEGKITVNEATEKLKAKPKPKAPAVTLLKPKSPEVRCETGAIIPITLHGLWDRRGEVLEIMKTLAAVRSDMVKGHADEDPLYCCPGMQRACEAIDKAHQEVRNTQLHALCPSCMGRNSDKCKHCRGRSFLSKQDWGLVPEEVRRLRK